MQLSGRVAGQVQPGQARATTTVFVLGWAMKESLDSRAVSQAPPETGAYIPDKAKKIEVCLVGGRKIVRRAIHQLLEHHGLSILQSHEDETEFAASLGAGGECTYGTVVLIVSGANPFAALHRIREALKNARSGVSLVVLSDRASRGHIYSALRIGAKAYVNLDAEPEELLKAIHMASQDKVYLSPDAAGLLVNDISTTLADAGAPRPAKINLTTREVEIVQLIWEGLSSKEIARRLHISAKTVENHRYNIYHKCEVDSLAGLIRHAMQLGLISL